MGEPGAVAARSPLQHVLAGLVTEINAVSELVERSSTGVSAQFQAIATESLRHSGLVNDLVETSSAIDFSGESISLRDVAGSLQEALADLVAKIFYLSSRGMTMVYSLEDVIDEMRQVNEAIGQIEKITGRTNMLALNAKIEAAHAGEAGRGFSIVANEVRDLATHTSKISQELRQKVDRAVSGLNSSFALLREIATIDMSEENVHANERMRAIIDGLVSQHSRFADALASTSDVTRKVTGDINSAVVQMQFQDRAKQVLENVCAVLALVGDTLAECGRADDAMTDMLAERIGRIVSLGDMRARVLARIGRHVGEVPPPTLPEDAGAGAALPDIELF